MKQKKEQQTTSSLIRVLCILRAFKSKFLWWFVLVGWYVCMRVCVGVEAGRQALGSLSPSRGGCTVCLPFKLKRNIWRSITSNGQDTQRRDLRSMGPTWCSASSEIGSRIFAGSLNTDWLKHILEEARSECPPAQLLSVESKKELVMDPRVLKTCVCSVGEGQQCGPPASVIKTACPASAVRRAWTHQP